MYLKITYYTETETRIIFVLLNAEVILSEELQWYYITLSW